MHGEWPRFDVDHLNGIRSDNRIENLRDVSPATNAQNERRARITNGSSGLLGVSRSSNGRRWVAGIVLNGQRQHIGTYDTPEEAQTAYLSAKRIMHDGCTI